MTGMIMNGLNKVSIIFDRTNIIWILNKRTKIIFIYHCITIVAKLEFYSDWPGTCDQHIYGLRKNFFIYKEFWLFNFVGLVYEMKKHGHCFCCGCCFVE